MNDLIDAVKTRFRSPILGYLLLTSLAVNWRPMFYLVVDNGSVQSRIEHFDTHTTTVSLLVAPLLTSVLIVISSPWVRYLFNLASSTPVHKIELLNLQAEDRVQLAKQKLEEARGKVLASKEAELISRAERDQKLEALQNEELRNRLRAEIDQLRSERDSLRSSVQKPSSQLETISEEALILLAAAAEGDGIITHMKYLEGSRIQADGRDFMEDNSPRTAAKWEAAIGELLSRKFISDQTGKRTVFAVTNLGYQFIEKSASQ